MGENKRIGGRKSNRVGTESREQKDKAMHICPKMGQKPKAQAWAEQNSEQYTPTLTNTIQRKEQRTFEKREEVPLKRGFGKREMKRKIKAWNEKPREILGVI